MSWICVVVCWILCVCVCVFFRWVRFGLRYGVELRSCVQTDDEVRSSHCGDGYGVLDGSGCLFSERVERGSCYVLWRQRRRWNDRYLEGLTVPHLIQLECIMTESCFCFCKN